MPYTSYKIIYLCPHSFVNEKYDGMRNEKYNSPSNNNNNNNKRLRKYFME